MSDAPSLPSVAVFGLGIIGSRAADHIAAAGYPLTTWSRSPRERTDFETDPSTAARNADIVACYLKDVPAVRYILGNIRDSLGPGKTFVTHATIDHATTDYLVAECARLGCGFLNAPFTGSKIAARNAALVYYAGGDSEVMERLRPFLEVTSTQIMEVSSPLAATILKLTTNLITASTVQALAEGLTVNLAHGISAETYLESIKPNACASVLASMKVISMAEGDFDPHFSLSNMLKDARYMLDLAERAGLATPGIANTATQMQKRNDLGEGEFDFSILFRQFEEA
ncbi:MAG: NAD(P)-dependent oxidoreductase [Verrucomicrobiota bacterium]|nr:NAD(P)-dependent oxidoreductase [Verrucomicrobiota bacterium]